MCFFVEIGVQILTLVLVPSELSKDVFWKRYFFRVHQIQTEEEKRKALLQGMLLLVLFLRSVLTHYITVTTENEEDFSWEDDEVEDGAATAVPKNAETEEKPSAPASQVNTANTSPRRSSEESYDVVSGNVSVSGEREDEDEEKQKEKPTAESDVDSDWE